MLILKKLRAYIEVLRGEHKIIRMVNKDNASAAELIRNTHSIEKGLSISNPRLGYGHKKQQEMMDRIRTLYRSESIYHHEACLMAVGALQKYLTYHKEHNYFDEFCEKIENFLIEFKDESIDSYGGIITFEKKQINFNLDEIERFFRLRHSIRDFSDIPIKEEVIRKAIILAQTAPSACNRQGVKCYVLSHDISMKIAKQMSGIGGFAESVDRFIIITGRTSAYRLDEINQYIVSASIFTGYLSLTLHLYGLGACIIQRKVLWSKSWSQLQDEYCIPTDEQMVCMIAVGNLKDSFDVPLSHRLNDKEVCTFIE